MPWPLVTPVSSLSSACRVTINPIIDWRLAKREITRLEQRECGDPRGVVVAAWVQHKHTAFEVYDRRVIAAGSACPAARRVLTAAIRDHHLSIIGDVRELRIRPPKSRVRINASQRTQIGAPGICSVRRSDSR